MEVVATFRYDANALFAADALANAGITSQLVERKESDATVYDISVSPANAGRARELLRELNLDDSPVAENADGYLKDFEEWTDKQYVRGYYTGGRIPRFMMGRPARRLLIVYVITFAVILFGNLSDNPDSPLKRYALPVVVVFIILGVLLYAWISRPKK